MFRVECSEFSKVFRSNSLWTQQYQNCLWIVYTSGAWANLLGLEISRSKLSFHRCPRGTNKIIWWWQSSGILCRVSQNSTDVSGVLTASIIRAIALMIYATIRRKMPVDWQHHTRGRENLKSHCYNLRSWVVNNLTTGINSHPLSRLTAVCYPTA
jgi:hypothetical protein